MKARLVNRITSTLDPGDPHPYLNGAWTPMFEEWDAEELDVVGQIPHDLDGVYLRNTENQVHKPLGRFHPFEGDGLIHSIRFHKGRASYRNRFVRTQALQAEAEAGRALWSGIAEMPSRSERPGWGVHGVHKDASSTDVVVQGGRALSSFYLCGNLYQLDPVTLEQHGAVSWEKDGAPDWFPREGASAHCEVDPDTGELLFFNYSRQAPYMHCGVVSREGKVLAYRPVPLPGPRFPHDMAFTRHYLLFADFPLFWNAQMLEKGLHVATLHDLPSRFALVPRPGAGGPGNEEVRWFEASPTYALHFINAWEEGDEVVLDGYRQQQPVPPPLAGYPRGTAQLMSNLDLHSLRPQPWRWRFNLRTGATKEGAINERICEFGSINRTHAGKPYRYAYSALGEPGWFLFNGLCKHDWETGREEAIGFGPGVFGSETPFAPREGATAEDDGYLVTFITDMNRDCSECRVYHAQDLKAGPLARVQLPARIPSGTHACWAGSSEL